MTGSQPRSPRAAGQMIATAVVAALVLLISDASSPAVGRSTRPPASVCGYLFEWLHVVRFPLQPDPHAAYSYVALNSKAAARRRVGFLVRGPFPYAAWTSWDVYGAEGKPVAVANDNAIVADRGSVNPFVVGSRVLARRRNFTLLYLPYGVAQSDTAPSLRRVAAANVFAPMVDKSFVLANRVYQAFAASTRVAPGVRPRPGSPRSARSTTARESRCLAPGITCCRARCRGRRRVHPGQARPACRRGESGSQTVPRCRGPIRHPQR